MKITFQLLDVYYSVNDKKPVIQILGKHNNEKFILLYEEFKPYCYLELKKIDDEIIKKIKDIKKEEFYVTDVKVVEKLVGKEKKKLIRMYVNLPSGIKPIKSVIKEQYPNLFVHSYESDIPFVKRFMVDLKLTPFEFYQCDGEEVNYGYSLKTFKIKNIKPVDTDYNSKLKILSFDIETYSKDTLEIKPEKNPVIMISLYSDDFQKVITYKRFKTDDKRIEFVESELEMINRFIKIVKEYNPDIITGYFSDGFDFPYLKKRASIYNIKLNLGFDNSDVRISGGALKSSKIKGIIHIDLFRFIRNILYTSLQTETLTLNDVAKELLHEEKVEVDINEIGESWDKNKNLQLFAKYNLQDARLTYLLSKKILPIIIEFSKIVGQPIYHTCRMSYSQLVEWYLIKRESEFDLVAPNKPKEDELKEREKQRYEGAFVYEPTPGLYENIVIFDFKSLYPTIIVTHNISPETINLDCDEKERIYPPLKDKKIWFCKSKKGFIPTVLKEILDRRARIKEIMKKASEEEHNLLYSRQYALKTIANSTYGYMGFPLARWYCIDCARSITAFGRHYITTIIKEAEEKGFKVIYSDTDSVFICLQNKKIEEAFNFLKEINKKLPGIMELEYEGFYLRGIFVSAKLSKSGAKKKYALIDEKGNLSIKGFETIRRNWSEIAKEVQSKVLEIILKDKDIEKAKEYVSNVIERVKNKKIENSKMIIMTQLQKNVNEYESVGPHVVAAKRMIDKGYRVIPGMLIRYIITKHGSKISEKVRLPEECKEGEYDPEYYINNQILPAVEGIFETIGIKKEILLGKGSQSSLNKFF